MGAKYSQLDYLKRVKILAFWKAGYSIIEIAKEIGVHKSTISREFRRNMTWITRGYWTYKPGYAQGYANERHKEKRKQIKFTKEVEKFVRKKLQDDWSPEQISGYAKRHKLFSISHEWIYQFILKDKQKGGDLYKHLRHQNKRYRKRYGSPARKEPIKNRRFIDERPKIVDEKSRIGDWEIDTIIGKNSKAVIVTVVERVSKKLVCKLVDSKKANLVKKAVVSGLRRHSKSVLTITGDNGVEFANHEVIAKSLKTDFYFAHPYSSWERGLSENTNGLIRQYLPKGTDLSKINDKNLAIISRKINNRPRKTLGYATPNEVFRLTTIKTIKSDHLRL